MPGNSTDVRKELTEIIYEIDKNQRISGFFATNMMRMAAAMRSFSEHVDERFDVVDASIKTLDTKVGLVGDEVRKMSARQEELFGRIGRQERQGRP